MPKKQPLDHLRSRKKPIHVDFPIVDDYQYLDRVDEARTALSRRELQVRLGSRRNEEGMSDEDRFELEELKSDLEAAQSALKPHQVWFRAKNLAPKDYDELVTKHPPTKEQRLKAKQDGNVLLYNPETFLDALTTMCVYFLYVETDDGEIEAAEPPFGSTRSEDAPKVLEEPVTATFLQEMKEDGRWAAGEILTLAGTAANVNQGVRQVAQLGNV